MTCKEFSHLIDRYLRAQLCEEEQDAFELHYFQCDNCFYELKIAERLFSKEISFRAEIPIPLIPRGWWLNWKSLTALAALVLVVTLSIWQITVTTHLKYLYQVSAVPAPPFIIMETRKGLPSPHLQTETIFHQAMEYYNQQKYLQALGLLGQIPTSEINARITFFQGICFLYTNQLASAVGNMDSIIATMNPSYYDEAIYYKAIALIRMDKEKEAIFLLRNLTEMFSPYSSRAKELIVKLN